MTRPPVPLPAAGRAFDARARWALPAVVVGLMVAGHMDRQVVVAMFPFLRSAWTLSDPQLGGLVSIVSFMVALCAVPIALVADRIGHARAIVAMVILWSGATIACALAQGYVQLLAMRAVVGAGEAAFGAVGAALLATRVPERVRVTTLSLFLAAALVGNAAGVLLGAVVSASWGWRVAFVVAGLPGLALVAAFVALTRHGGTPPGPAEPRKRARLPVQARALLANRTVLFTCLGGALQLITVASLAAWLTAYFYRHHGLTPAEAGAMTSAVLFAGVAGAVGVGYACDRWSIAHPRARTLVPVAVAAATAILGVAAFGFVPEGTAQKAAIVALGVVMTGCLGPATAIVVDVVDQEVRATGVALLALSQNLLGLAAGPLATGMLSAALGLDRALALIPLASAVAAVAFFLASRTYEADRRRVVVA